jgi:hypothetical protein
MGLWKWLLEKLIDFPGDGRKDKGDGNKYVPRGVERFMGKDIGQVTVWFRDAFGDHKEEYDEEDYDDDDGGGGD